MDTAAFIFFSTCHSPEYVLIDLSSFTLTALFLANEGISVVLLRAPILLLIAIHMLQPCDLHWFYLLLWAALWRGGLYPNYLLSAYALRGRGCVVEGSGGAGLACGGRGAVVGFGWGPRGLDAAYRRGGGGAPLSPSNFYLLVSVRFALEFLDSPVI